MKTCKKEFAEYYETAELVEPPMIERREIGFVPFDYDGVIRHKSIDEYGSVRDFFAGEVPRHAYVSASLYDDPGNRRSMEHKEWIGCDLVFDFDFPMDRRWIHEINVGKYTVNAFVGILEDLFGVDRLSVNFSGNRGFHVWARDGRLLDLEVDARGEVLDFIKASDVAVSALDVPVTKNVNTLMRWPGSIHGDSGLVAQPLDDLPTFNPLDAIPEGFL